MDDCLQKDNVKMNGRKKKKKKREKVRANEMHAHMCEDF